MGLLTECLSRLSAQRLKELTRADNPGGLVDTTLAGTVTVTNGSLIVTGAGTSFTSFGANILIQFSAQPGVNYVVASIQSATQLTLAKAYNGVTTAGGTATLPACNYVVLQDAVFDAQAHFQAETGLVYDDVTANAVNAGANPTLNRCLWAGVALVVAYLYEYRGHPWPEAEVKAAWDTANRRLKAVLNSYGDGAFSAPISDSRFNPSYGPVRLPEFDNERWGNISPNAPGGASDASTSDWGGGA